MMAAAEGYAEVVGLLLKNCVNVDLRNKAILLL